MFPVHLINNGGCTAQRLIAEQNWFQRLQCTDPVMIDDLKDVGVLDAIYRLGTLIVIYQDQLLLRRLI